MKLTEYLLSIPLLIQLYTEQDYQDDYSKAKAKLAADFKVPKVKVYDFIIVGSGTAGCVLARRLSSEPPFSKVLLLEAGGNPPPAATVLYFSEIVGNDRRINYFYRTMPMTNANLKNRGIVINHTGKMLGGSGSHNEMIHNRGSPKDYDNWAEITKDNSWTYANVLKYFKKSENFIGKRFRDENFTEFYGKNGPITVDTYEVPLLPLWFDAAHELGYEKGDPNGFQREGFVPVNKAIYQGRRMSSFSEYVKKWENDTLNSERLTVIRYANVSEVADSEFKSGISHAFQLSDMEILLNSEKRAYGVAFTRHGFPQKAHASKEVIISAGTFSSPLLLMKSGIGPTEILKKAKIPVKVEIESVGKNLNEHPSLMLGPFRVNDSSFFPRLYSNGMDSLMEDYRKGLGVLANKFQGPQCFCPGN